MISWIPWYFNTFSAKTNSSTKSLASSAGVSALLGITEPALFGVNLKYRFPFFCALIGSGIAAAIAALLKVVAVSLGSVNDPVFSSESIVKGIAIKPNGSTVYSPVDGTVQTVFETGLFSN